MILLVWLLCIAANVWIISINWGKPYTLVNFAVIALIALIALIVHMMITFWSKIT